MPATFDKKANPRNLEISEILELVHNEKDRTQKKLILLKNDSLYLQSTLWNNFHPVSEFIELPEGEIPAQPHDGTPIDLSQRIRAGAAKIFYVLQKKHHAKESKKLQIFLQYYEGMHPKERNIFEHTVRHNLQNIIDGLDYQLVRETYPELFPEQKTSEAAPVDDGGKKKSAKKTSKKKSTGKKANGQKAKKSGSTKSAKKKSNSKSRKTVSTNSKKAKEKVQDTE
jgi:hypothetical protein